MNLTNELADLTKANRYSMRCIWIAAFTISLSWILNILNIFIIDQKIMNTATIGVWILLALAYVVKFTLGLDSKVGSFLILFLLISTISFANVELSYQGTLFMFFPMVCSVLYNEKCYTIFAFILTTIGLMAVVVLGFKYGLCDANMLLLTTSTTEYHANAILAGNFELNYNVVGLLLYYFFPRFLALIGFTSLLSYIKKHIQEKTEKEVETRRIAETDGLTGLFNRNKYNQVTEQKSSAMVAAIYIDVNNLKKVNDTMGHEQGDVLICGMANILKNHESDSIKAYRLGGDEFCVIIENPKAGETEGLVEIFRKDVSEAKLEFDLTLSAAMGYAEGTSNDIKEVIKEADDKMYANKIAMKKEMGLL